MWSNREKASPSVKTAKPSNAKAANIIIKMKRVAVALPRGAPNYIMKSIPHNALEKIFLNETLTGSNPRFPFKRSNRVMIPSIRPNSHCLKNKPPEDRINARLSGFVNDRTGSARFLVRMRSVAVVADPGTIWTLPAASEKARQETLLVATPLAPATPRTIPLLRRLLALLKTEQLAGTTS